MFLVTNALAEPRHCRGIPVFNLSLQLLNKRFVILFNEYCVFFLTEEIRPTEKSFLFSEYVVQRLLIADAVFVGSGLSYVDVFPPRHSSVGKTIWIATTITE